MSTPFPLEEQAQQDTGEPTWDPWKGPDVPHWYSGMGFTEDTAYLGPLYRVAASVGSGAAKGELVLGGLSPVLAQSSEQDDSFLDLEHQEQTDAAAREAAGQAIEADAKARIRALRPDPQTTGIAVQTLHSLGEGLSLALEGGAVGGGAGAFTALASTEGFSAYQDLLDQGVKPSTAAEAGTVRGLLAGAGGVTPLSFGSSLVPRLLTGMASNVGYGIANRSIDSAILRHAGYSEMADQEQVFDRTQMFVDLALGAGFGAWSHIQHAQAVKDVLDTDSANRDAALVANLALRDRRSGPGVPVDPEAAAAHAGALEKALQDLQDGKRVNVAGTGVEDSSVLTRGGEPNPAVGELFAQSLRDSGLLEEQGKLEQLEGILGRKLAGEPEPAPAATVPDKLDLENFGLPAPPRPLPDAHELLRPHWSENPELQDTTPEREALRRELVDERFAGARPVAEGEEPVALVMGGGGASGKGTVLRLLGGTGELPENAVHLDSDEFKTGNAKKGLRGIPEYREIVKAGDSRAASATHDESSYLYKLAHQRATGGADGTGPKYHLVLDRTLGDSAKSLTDLQALRDRGYRIRLVGVTVEPETAIARAVKRAQGPEKRYVPLDALLKAHKGFSNAFPHYDAIADETDLFDNNGERPVLIARRRKGGAELQVLHEAEYNDFVRKGDLNEQARTLRQVRESGLRVTEPNQTSERGPPRGARPGSLLQQPEGARSLGPGASGPAGRGRGQLERRAGGISSGRLETVSTAAGRQLETRGRLAEAADLITSDRPQFPQELQPRQRGERRILEAQVREIAANLIPERLGASPEADRGAPIVSSGNEVESGNGRVMALREAYAKHPERAAAYRAFLESEGHNLEGYKEPVLVRERLTPLSMQERAAFALEANQSATASLSPLERGMADARRLDTDMLSLLTDGELSGRGNDSFVRAFLDGIPTSERAALLNPDGSLSQEGVRRAQAAVLAKAYGGTESSNHILGRMLESTDAEQRNILGALLDASPAFARLRAMVADGVLAPQFDITPKVLAAVEEAAAVRESGQALVERLAQVDMLKARDPLVDAILKRFYGEGGKRAAGRPKIVDALSEYVTRATAQRLDQGSLFAAPPLSPEELLAAKESEKPEAPAMKPGADMFGLRTPQGGGKRPQEPAAEGAGADRLANQALEAHPNLAITGSDGSTIPAAAAKLAADQERAATEGAAPSLLQSLADCAFRNAA